MNLENIIQAKIFRYVKGRELETIIHAKLFRFHKGRENAITIEDLLEYGQQFNPRLKNRTLRNIYSKKLPVCSCDGGIYWPIKPGDMDDFKWFLLKPTKAIRERYYRVAKAHPHLLPNDQMELFGGGQ